jgi:NAD(P)-dependent dehydrogenase (short-subunit alcohol dehydrogenase family)
MARNVFITGANRGLGQSLVEKFLAEGWNVFAGERPLDKAATKVVDASAALTRVGLDVVDTASVARAARHVAERARGLDVLINNAAVNPSPDSDAPIGELDFEAIRYTFDVNAVGPLRVIQEFLPLLERGSRKLIINVSSEAGSIQRSGRERTYGYCMSKAAMNMQTTILQNALKGKGFNVISIHPGWMRTQMGGKNAALDPRESAEGMYRIIDTADASTPRFVVYDGEPYPW